MAEISRLAGAILVASDSVYFLVGQLKEPCNFLEYGFKDPGEIKAPGIPYVKLEVISDNKIPKKEILTMSGNGEDLANKLADIFMITRNGSISERIWDLVCEYSQKNEGKIDGNWASETPVEIWDIVRDSILRC